MASAAEISLRGSVLTFRHSGIDFTANAFAAVCCDRPPPVSDPLEEPGVAFGRWLLPGIARVLEIRSPSLAVSLPTGRKNTPVILVESKRRSSCVEYTIPISKLGWRRLLARTLEELIEEREYLATRLRLRSILFNGSAFDMRVTGPGPTPNSLRASVSGADLHTVLIVRPAPVDIPETVRGSSPQRMARSHSAPGRCRISLVAGLQQPQRLIAGIPTRTRVPLPFSVDAPFETDSEFAVVSPERSPLNAWLLKMAGQLAANTMCAWLGNRSLTVRDRAEALCLMTDEIRPDGCLEATCAKRISEATSAALRGDRVAIRFDEEWVSGPLETVRFT